MMGRRKQAVPPVEEPSATEVEDSVVATNGSLAVPQKEIFNQTVVITSETELKKKMPAKRKNEEPPKTRRRPVREKKQKNEEMEIGDINQDVAGASKAESKLEYRSVGTDPTENAEFPLYEGLKEDIQILTRSVKDFKSDFLMLSKNLNEFKTEVLNMLEILIDSKSDKEAGVSLDNIKMVS